MTFAPGQVVTVFRSRLRPDAEQGYADTAEMVRLATAMPGFVESSPSWPTTASGSPSPPSRTTPPSGPGATPDHRLAQQAGRDRFYGEYSIQVCTTVRTSRFPTPG